MHTAYKVCFFVHSVFDFSVGPFFGRYIRNEWSSENRWKWNTITRFEKKNKQKNRHKMKYTVSNRRWKRDKKGGHQVRVNESTFLSHLHNELAVNTRFHKKLTLSEGVRVFFWTSNRLTPRHSTNSSISRYALSEFLRLNDSLFGAIISLLCLFHPFSRCSVVGMPWCNNRGKYGELKWKKNGTNWKKLIDLCSEHVQRQEPFIPSVGALLLLYFFYLCSFYFPMCIEFRGVEICALFVLLALKRYTMHKSTT